VAFLGDNNSEATLDQYAPSYPTSGTVDFTVDGDNAIIQFQWQYSGPGPLLMMALPHHMDAIVNPQKTDLVLNTMKGNATGIVGDTWQLAETLTTQTWNTASPPQNSYIPTILSALNNDSSYVPNAGDVYYMGGELGRLGRLALVADELNQPQLANKVRTTMKTILQSWLTGTNKDALKYEPAWGGIITLSGANCSGCDFGNGWFNDHHFHYGYYLYAVATVAKEDLAWAQSHLEAILALARDIANPSTSDTYFPVFRMHDWYDGHSWASGLFVFSGGGNQESSSEAINAYYGLYLLGVALGNDDIRNMGRILLATEIRSAQKYWHMPSSSNIYENVFAANKMVGRVWTTGAQYSTWFGTNVEFIHLIQMLPFTPITEALLTPSFVQEEYPVLAKGLTRGSPAITMSWKVYTYMAHAIADPIAAHTQISSLTYSQLISGTGNSATNVWHWLATRPGATWPQ